MNLYFRFLHYRLSVLLLCLLTAGSARAQTQTKLNRQLANNVADTDRGCVTFLVCGAVTNENLAVDADAGSAAEVTSPEAISSALLRLQFPTPAPAGYRAGIALSSPIGLDLSALGSVRLLTYLSSSSSPRAARQDFTVGSLLKVASLSNTVTLLSFPVTQDFDQLEVRVGGAVTGSYTVRVHYAETYDLQAPLPVTLTSFSGQRQGGAVELAWQTASEQNASHFVVERSADGRTFGPLGRVSSRGAVARPQAYQFRDAHAAALGVPTLYYRLRQVDLDGQEQLSPVVVVSRPTAAPEQPRVEVHPNPAPAGAPLRLSWAGPTARQLRLYGSRGELVYQAPLPAPAAQFQGPVVAAGLYLVVLLDQQGRPVARQQLVVQN